MSDIEITSVGKPDGPAECLITWGPLQWPAPAADVRRTALDLVTCAAYAEMMMELVAHAGISARVASKFFTVLLSRAGRTCFGGLDTLALTPAGSSSLREAFVVVKHRTEEGMLTPDEARGMALQWLEAAEGSESDQLVAEALRSVLGLDQARRDAVFGYMQKLRDRGSSS